MSGQQQYLGAVVLPLAHLLHWYFMPLYAAPMLIVLYSTIKETLRQRREGEQQAEGAEPGEREGPADR